MKFEDMTQAQQSIVVALHIVEDVLMDPLAGRDMWSILSVLRGPDYTSDTEKAKFTVPLRCAIFPRIAAETRDHTQHEQRLLSDFTGWSKAYGGDHFRHHASEAGMALLRLGREVKPL